ncbi:MAG: hypothetical protein WCO57_00880 [Verrucomicrobiota bacterium]
MKSSIDITKLEKVRSTASKITARCPACAVTGGDGAGQHLVIFSNGKFACAAFSGDSEHRREIYRLVGIKVERDPEAERQWRKGRVRVAAADVARKQLTRAAREKRATIIADHPWTEAEVRRDSPEQRLGWLYDPRRFLDALFDPAAVVWTGDTHESGQNGKYAAHWRTVRVWQEAPEETVGPMVSPATWNPGTVSRSGSNVATAPFVVLDFDGLDGKPPATPDELRQHIAASLAIIRWLRERLAWELAAILFTGSKSLHAWFRSPPAAALESLRVTAPALGIDAGLIGHPEHPCRLPGWIHPKTGIAGRVLWLQHQT